MRVAHYFVRLNLFEVRSNPHEVILNKASENLAKKHNSSSNGGDLWWTSVITCHVVSHLGYQPLPKITNGRRIVAIFLVFVCGCYQFLFAAVLQDSLQHVIVED